jgi:hypothetical protein
MFHSNKLREKCLTHNSIEMYKYGMELGNSGLLVLEMFYSDTLSYVHQRYTSSIQWRTEWGGGEGYGVQPPPLQKFLSFDKAEPNSQFRGK